MPRTFINVIMGTCKLEAMSKWDEKMSILRHISIFKHVYQSHTLFCIVKVKVMELYLHIITIQIMIIFYSIYTWQNKTHTLCTVQPWPYIHKQQCPLLFDSRCRYLAYRSFVSWCWGYLGRKIRVVIPSCVVQHVRGEFPDAEGQYVGFKPPPL